MTRHFFRFTLLGGSVVEMETNHQDDAQKVITHRWSTGGGTYFTPWMTPVTEAGYGVGLARVNLMHVMSIEHQEMS